MDHEWLHTAAAHTGVPAGRCVGARRAAKQAAARVPTTAATAHLGLARPSLAVVVVCVSLTAAEASGRARACMRQVSSFNHSSPSHLLRVWPHGRNANDGRSTSPWGLEQPRRELRVERNKVRVTPQVSDRHFGQNTAIAASRVQNAMKMGLARGERALRVAAWKLARSPSAVARVGLGVAGGFGGGSTSQVKGQLDLRD